MRTVLIFLFAAILGAMLVVTIVAALDRSMFEAGAELLEYPWFVATLIDAYFGFLTFYVWVAYKERTMSCRAVWFLLIMTFGNIAMATYVLIQLSRLRPGNDLSALLLRQPDETAGS